MRELAIVIAKTHFLSITQEQVHKWIVKSSLLTEIYVTSLEQIIINIYHL
jgi:hypothetical protein